MSALTETFLTGYNRDATAPYSHRYEAGLQAVADAAGRQAVEKHAQTMADAQSEVVLQALVDAELRGYTRQIDERLAHLLPPAPAHMVPPAHDGQALRPADAPPSKAVLAAARAHGLRRGDSFSYDNTTKEAGEQ